MYYQYGNYITKLYVVKNNFISQTECGYNIWQIFNVNIAFMGIETNTIYILIHRFENLYYITVRH